MIKFTSTITDADGQAGVYRGTVVNGEVQTTELAWEAGNDYVSVHTRSYHLAIEGGKQFELTGHAYRNLDQTGDVPKFEWLACLDERSAAMVAAFAEKGDKLFRSVVTTSDATMSCTIYTSDDDHNTILSQAKEEGHWAINEGNPIYEAYFGGGAGEDIEEIDLTDLVGELLREAISKAKAEANAKALNLAAEIARMAKWGEVVDGKPFPANRDYDDLEASHQALMRLIDEARRITSYLV